MEFIAFFLILFLMAFIVGALLATSSLLFPHGILHSTPRPHLLAARLGGRITRQGWFQYPVIHFRHGATPVSFRLRERGWVEVKIALQVVAPLVLEIRRPDMLASLTTFAANLKFTEITQIRVDDEIYQLRTSQRENVRWFLDRGVLDCLERLHALGSGLPLYVSIHFGQLAILKKRAAGMSVPEELYEFVRLALRLHDHLALVREEGIEFNVSEQAHAVGDLTQLKCSVCGGELGVSFVECHNCRAPHHQDCWTYNGCCATFGCRSTKFKVAGTLQSLPWYRQIFRGSD